MKKIFLLFLILIILISNYSITFAAPQEELFNYSGKILKEIGVLIGNNNNDLMLDSKLKRQDMVVLISRLYQEEDKAKDFTVKDDFAFTDVKNSYYKPYIAWSIDKKLIVGIGDDRFGYDNLVEVQQLQALLLRALGYGEEIKDYKNVPVVAKSLGLMDGLSAESSDQVSRGLMAAMSLNALRLNMRGSSLTLSHKLKLELPDKFEMSISTKIDRNSIRFQGRAKGTQMLKLHLKPLSKNMGFEERYININLKKDGEFTLLLARLPLGKYEYRFLGDELSTSPQSIEIK